MELKTNKTFSLNENIIKALEQYSIKSGIFKSKVVEFAIIEYLEKRGVTIQNA